MLSSALINVSHSGQSFCFLAASTEGGSIILLTIKAMARSISMSGSSLISKFACALRCSLHLGEKFALGIDPKSLHATVLMQTVYSAVVRHSGGFLKHMAISVTEKVKIMVA